MNYKINAEEGKIEFSGTKQELLETLDVHTCPDCKGTGSVWLMPYDGETVSWDTEELPCPNCPGTGMVS